MAKTKKKTLTTIALELTSSQHLCCMGTIDKTPAYFLVDTGASHSCFAQEKAEAFGFILRGEKIQASGANRLAMEAQNSQSKIVCFGELEVPLNFMIMDFGPINESLNQHDVAAIDGIIGADFLLKTGAVIRYIEKEMDLQF